MHKLTNYTSTSLKLFEMVNFGRKKSFFRFLSSLQSFLFQNFATNTAKVKIVHF